MPGRVTGLRASPTARYAYLVLYIGEYHRLRLPARGVPASSTTTAIRSGGVGATGMSAGTGVGVGIGVRVALLASIWQASAQLEALRSVSQQLQTDSLRL